jgi:hypothetical protein
VIFPDALTVAPTSSVPALWRRATDRIFCSASRGHLPTPNDFGAIFTNDGHVLRGIALAHS